MGKFIWQNGRRIPKNTAVEENGTRRLILEIDSELYDEIEAHCNSLGVTNTEWIITLCEDNLPEDPDTSGDDEDLKKRTKKLSEDGKQPAKIGADDPDNATSKAKPRPPLPPTPAAAQLTPMTILERAQLNGQQQFLITAGRITEAAQIRKLMGAHDAAVRTQNAPALTEARSRLVEVMAATGTKHFNQLH